MLTKQHVAQKLTDYLGHRISLNQLVDWAERAMMEEDLDEKDVPLLRDILARLGLGVRRRLRLDLGRLPGVPSFARLPSRGNGHQGSH